MQRRVLVAWFVVLPGLVLAGGCLANGPGPGDGEGAGGDNDSTYNATVTPVPGSPPADDPPGNASNDRPRDTPPPVPDGVPEPFVGSDADADAGGHNQSGPPPTEPAAAPLGPAPALAFTRVLDGLDRPTVVTHAGDGSGRLFVAEQSGRVGIVRDGAKSATPFLDVSALTMADGERGLLGVAFHPAYASNGRFFVSYTDTVGDSVIAAYRVSDADPDRADAASAAVLITVAQPRANHNGGGLAFGPDGYLYIGFGDGGVEPDDAEHPSQNAANVLGALLRVDVDAAAPYGIPDTNPFADGSGRPEVWATGLRNPWRFSFDSVTGDLFIADVGESRFEEIDVARRNASGGANYGWPLFEGPAPFNGTATLADHAAPVFAYGRHDGHCAVIGGAVYRGAVVTDLVGYYVFGDYCSGTLWALAEKDGAWDAEPVGNVGTTIATFGTDEAGELYVTTTEGDVFRVTAA